MSSQQFDSILFLVVLYQHISSYNACTATYELWILTSLCIASLIMLSMRLTSRVFFWGTSSLLVTDSGVSSPKMTSAVLFCQNAFVTPSTYAPSIRCWLCNSWETPSLWEWSKWVCAIVLECRIKPKDFLKDWMLSFEFCTTCCCLIIGIPFVSSFSYLHI